MEQKSSSNKNNKENENLKLIQLYWDEAKKRLSNQYHVDKNDKRQGEYKSWYSNGQIGTICNFKDGEYLGRYTRWLENGAIDMIDINHFKKGMHGTKIEFKYGK